MNKKIVRKWLRIIHRDLGYFFVGVILIYAFSGILLNHKITAYSTISHTHQLPANLNKEKFSKQWNQQQTGVKLKNIIPQNNQFQLFLEGGIGEYNIKTGKLSYETYKRNLLIDFIHRLHYNTIVGWKYFADFFAVSLIFFAISGMFLSKGKKGLMGRGKWLVFAGIAITCLIVLL